MKVFPCFLRDRISLIASLAVALAAACGQASAADPTPADSSGTQQESVKIEPYTGRPIFLDEPEQVAAAPTIVTRETIPEKYPGTQTVRVERQVAHYSDNNYAADGFYREFHPNG